MNLSAIYWPLLLHILHCRQSLLISILFHSKFRCHMRLLTIWRWTNEAFMPLIKQKSVPMPHAHTNQQSGLIVTSQLPVLHKVNFLQSGNKALGDLMPALQQYHRWFHTCLNEHILNYHVTCPKSHLPICLDAYNQHSKMLTLITVNNLDAVLGPDEAARSGCRWPFGLSLNWPLTSLQSMPQVMSAFSDIHDSIKHVKASSDATQYSVTLKHWVTNILNNVYSHSQRLHHSCMVTQLA